MDPSPENGGSSARREDKTRKQRESLRLPFADPLACFSISREPGLWSLSQELTDEGERLKERVRSFSAFSDEVIRRFDPKHAQKYVAERERLAEEVASHIKACRNKVREAQENKLLDRNNAKKLLFGMEKFDAALLKERAALARNRMKLEFGILSHPISARIGEAYLAAIVESLPESAGERVKKQGSRDKYDQGQFKALIRQAYTPTKETPAYDPPYSDPPMLWCPITRAWHDSMSMTTAHIVPYEIGEVNAAYIFGLPPDEGWATIWSFENGLLLYSRVEQAMDAAQLVIIPDVDSDEGLKVVILDESILDKSPFAGGPKYRDLNNTKLVFKTEARPLKRYLYFLCLISLLRRRRFYVEGSERDQAKLQMGEIWGSPGKWMRCSIIRALALELGDILRAEEVVEGDLDMETFLDELSPKSERQMAVEIRKVIEGVEDD